MLWNQCRHVYRVYKSIVIGASESGNTVHLGYSSEHDRDHLVVRWRRWNFGGSRNARSGWTAWNFLRHEKYHQRRASGLLFSSGLGKSERKSHASVQIGYPTATIVARRGKLGGKVTCACQSSWNEEPR